MPTEESQALGDRDLLVKLESRVQLQRQIIVDVVVVIFFIIIIQRKEPVDAQVAG